MKKIDITPQELCERLFKGESFYNIEERTLTYSKQKGKFVAYNRDGESYNPDMNVWFKGDIYIKPHWSDNLSEENPVLCKVYGDITGNEHVVFICGIRSEVLFVDSNGISWKNAEPVKLEDACIWEGE